MEQSKKCTKCGTEKALSQFSKNKSLKDGYESTCKSCKKAYYQTNKDKILEKKKAYRKANKDIISERQKAYREDNKDKIKEYHKAYREANKDKVNEYQKKRLKEDSLFKLKRNLRNRLSLAIKRKGYSKNTKTADTLGCSWEFLKDYIEAHFTKGMTWDNYGAKGWHLDHITPLSLAKTRDEIYLLNHYTNLQPLWAEDNLKKSDSIHYEQCTDYCN